MARTAHRADPSVTPVDEDEDEDTRAIDRAIPGSETQETDENENDLVVSDSEQDKDGQDEAAPEQPERSADLDPSGPDGSDPPPLRRAVRVWLVALSALLVVLLAGAIVVGLKWWGGQSEDNDRASVLDAGRQVALNLTAINFNTADADVNRVIDSSTGDFRNLFTQNLKSYVDIVKENQVVTTGQVTEAGISDMDGDVAHVLLAVQSTVRNKAAADGESRTYRMDLQMERQDDASWLVSRVDFVP